MAPPIFLPRQKEWRAPSVRTRPFRRFVLQIPQLKPWSTKKPIPFWISHLPPAKHWLKHPPPAVDLCYAGILGRCPFLLDVVRLLKFVDLAMQQTDMPRAPLRYNQSTGCIPPHLLAQERCERQIPPDLFAQRQSLHRLRKPRAPRD